MKLAFIVTDKRIIRFGIMYLSTYLKAYTDCDVSLLEYKDDNQIIKEVRGLSPDIIGYSVMTGDYTQLSKINLMLKKQGINFFSVWGGPQCTFNQEIIEDDGVDAICIGEGEEALAELCRRWPLGENGYNMRNWIFKTSSGIIRNGLRSLIDLDKLPLPDYTMFELKDKRTISATLSRGCLFKCTYCFNRDWKRMYEIKQKPVRVMNLDNIMKTLMFLKENYSSIEFVLFHDSVFPSMYREWIGEFSKRYPKEVGIPFQVNLHPAMVRKELIEKLKSAGAMRVNFAIESGSREIREKVLDRYTPSRKIIRSARIIKDAGLFLSIQNMTCLPHETWKDAKETFELNIKCKPDISVVSKFVPYPKTVLTEMAIKDGYLNRGDFEKEIPDNYHWISLLNFKNKHDKQKMEFLVNFFTLGTFFPFLKYIIYVLVNIKPSPFIIRVYAYIDTHAWLTITRQDTAQMMKMVRRPVISRLVIFARLTKSILLNQRNRKTIM